MRCDYHEIMTLGCCEMCRKPNASNSPGGYDYFSETTPPLQLPDYYYSDGRCKCGSVGRPYGGVVWYWLKDSKAKYWALHL